MDRFIVSARKYRPQLFDTVVGQSHITTTLKNAIRNNQLAHAFLFCGPRGVGKTTCARILGKTINCEKRTKEGEACNKCTSCISFNEGTSLNIHELDAASNNSVDDIRTLVDQVRFAPQAGKYKVYIIDEVHMLSSSAFNAFLKTLEEPPSYAIFILATTEKHKILPTILSRCQIFDFKRITTQDTVEHLEAICQKEKVRADKAALQVIAQKSEGCMRDALSIMDKIVSFSFGELNYENTLEHLNILDADYYFRLLDCMLAQDLAGAMLLYDSINQKGFEGDLVLNGFSEFLRNLLVCKDAKAAGLLDVVESFREKYISVSQQVSTPLLISSLNILNEAEINYRAARNKKLHVELVLIRLCYLNQALQIVSDAEGLHKKKQVESARPLAYRQLTSPGEGAAKKNIKAKAGNSITTDEKLIVEEPDPPGKDASKANTDEYNANPPSVLGTKSPALNQSEVNANGGQQVVVPDTAATKISSLDKIRQKYKNNGAATDENDQQPLRIDILQAAWKEYTGMLHESRNPAASSLEMAVLAVKDANTFEVTAPTNIEQKFIEQERNHLYSFLRKKLKNRLLQFSIAIDENLKEKKSVDIPLSAREQFFRMAEEYPMVKELKDRLKLDLDY